MTPKSNVTRLRGRVLYYYFRSTQKSSTEIGNESLAKLWDVQPWDVHTEAAKVAALLPTDVEMIVLRTKGPLTRTGARTDESDRASRVFDYWRERIPETIGRSRMKFGGKRRSSVIARLRDGYTVEELERAVDGCFRSKFHTNGGHLDLELIARSPEKVDFFMRLAPRPPVEPTEGATWLNAKPIAYNEVAGQLAPDIYQRLRAAIEPGLRKVLVPMSIRGRQWTIDAEIGRRYLQSVEAAS